SLHWDQASRWGIDWLGRLAAYAPAVAGNQIWMADATSGPTDPDAIQKAALSLFCQRLGNEVLTISIGSTKGFRDMTSERPPDRVVLAGKEAGWPAISQWAFSFRSETDLRVQDTFLAGGLSKEGEPTPTRTLSSEPLTAARQIIDML
ncbi:MAG TPA: hypothetical protein VLG27_02010, partial [Candidatus Saccharimonadia bacterium]|nr:hypothetical protein [Candidatus Saccharimonadia bacterium]